VLELKMTIELSKTDLPIIVNGIVEPADNKASEVIVDTIVEGDK
jgi:hypothetical protein